MEPRPVVGDADAQAIERAIAGALERRSLEGIRVLGFGEVGVAVAWPSDEPRFVAKRLVSCEHRDAAADIARNIGAYLDAVASFVTVAPTTIQIVEVDGGRWAPYLFQRLYTPDQLVSQVLADDGPDPDHPVVAALAAAISSSTADGRLALDSQFSNFAWVDGVLHYFDVGLPLMYDEHGKVDVDLSPMYSNLPTVLRPILKPATYKILEAMGGLQGSLEHAAVSLVRMDLGRWLEPTLTHFNRIAPTTIEPDAVRERADKLHRQMKSVKSLQRLERGWRTKVRRRPYDFFITDSFTNEIL